MRNCFVLLMLCFNLSLVAQKKPDLSELSVQINKFISDSNNNFLTFKGSVKEIIGDTIYSSSLHLAGTVTTEIWVARSDSNFVSVDIDTMLTKHEASSIVTKWKNYLKKILPQTFKVEPFTMNASWFNTNGYAFKNHNLYISVAYSNNLRYVSQRKKGETYNVALMIGKK
jgi:hypothetical protein